MTQQLIVLVLYMLGVVAVFGLITGRTAMEYYRQHPTVGLYLSIAPRAIAAFLVMMSILWPVLIVACLGRKVMR